jgi:hypothetical protein
MPGNKEMLSGGVQRRAAVDCRNTPTKPSALAIQGKKRMLSKRKISKLVQSFVFIEGKSTVKF